MDHLKASLSNVEILRIPGLMVPLRSWGCILSIQVSPWFKREYKQPPESLSLVTQLYTKTATTGE
jgi:hypothetical protein